jgi:hypothetical protein
MQHRIPNGLTSDRVAIDSISPSPFHARIHSRHQQRKLKQLLTQFGQVRPLLVNPNREIIDGHGIWAALKELDAAFVDIVIIADQTPAALRALAVAINRSCEEAKWEKGKLRAEFEFLLDVGFDLTLTCFDQPEIEFVVETDAPQANVIEDASAIPPCPDRPVSQLRDIFQLRSHRVGCGSALDLAFIDSVRGNLIPDCGIVDPPYGLPTRFFSGRGKTHHPNFVQGAGEMTSAELYQFFRGSLEVLRTCCSPRALIYAFMDWRHGLELAAAARGCGLSQANLCVWAKTNAGMGSLYRSQHELVFVFKAGNEPHVNNVELGRHGRNRSNLWTYAGMSSFGADRDELLALHPSVKPTKLLADIMRDTTNRGGVVLDSFLGSGSTLAAAEEIGRTCIGIDLDPRYVDVSILRWQKLTGLDAIHVQSGETFNARAQRLLPAPKGARDGR